MNIPPSQPVSDLYTPGVYFLYNGETLVYIGQSKAIELRIEQHRSMGKVFDRYSFIRIDDIKERLRQEAAFIQQLQPQRQSERSKYRSVTIRLDRDIYNAIARMAAEEGRTVPKTIERLIMSHPDFQRFLQRRMAKNAHAAVGGVPA